MQNLHFTSFELVYIMTNFQDLNGRVAVVTGGARGIGKAVAEALVQRGAKVAVGDLLAKEGQEFIDQLNQKYAHRIKLMNMAVHNSRITVCLGLRKRWQYSFGRT